MLWVIDMELKRVIKESGYTMYSLSKKTDIPYSTLNDFCNGKKDLSKCASSTLYKLASALGLTMEEMIVTPDIKKRHEAVSFSNAINAIEGVPVSDYAVFLSELWADGIISNTQLKQALAAYHKRTISERR